MIFSEKRIAIFIPLIFLLTGGPARFAGGQSNTFAQDSGVEVQRRELERIRAEIEKYKRKVTEQQRKEASLLEVLSDLDREIDLTRGLLHSLKKEEQRKIREIGKIEQDIGESQSELKRLQQLFARRAGHFYKYGRMKDVEVLLSSGSLNRALIWWRYQKLLMDNDRRNFQNILEKKSKIENRGALLQLELAEKQKILKEKQREEANLKSSREDRNRILKEIRQSKQTYQRRLQEYESAAKEIQRLIAAEEKRRLASVKEGVQQVETNFPALKGKMMWPVEGKVVAKFGKYRHPQLNTITENLGIDIRAEMGAPVRAVGKGRVTAITWQRGRGNIVIVSHYGGYYTVYTHLSEILVGVGEEVEAGQTLGSVGDSGSLEGPVLHFQIWKNTQNLDPEEWLR